jgi:hypothetical protein
MFAADAGVGSAPAPAADTALDVELKLVQPGREPRRLLRMGLALGAHRGVKLTTRVGTVARPAKQRLPRPRLDEQSVECATDVVAKEGKAELALRCGELPVLRAPLSTRGAALVLGATEGDPREAWEQARAQALLGAAPVLPVEPVGVGAKWEVTVSESAYGLPRKRTRRYLLESLEGGVATVAWTEGATTTPQRMRPPSPFARGDLVGFELVGDGKVEVVLGDTPVVTRGRGTRSEWAKIRSFQGPKSVFLDVVTVTSFVLP